MGFPDYTSQYPPAHNDTYVKATTVQGNYEPYFATDPAKSLTGIGEYNNWLSHAEDTDQRFHVDLGSSKIIKRIYYENAHHEGGYLTDGAKNFTFWGSNTGASFSELTYGTDTGWTQLTISTNVMLEHVALDQADPQYVVVTNSTAYRYYAFKFADNYGGTYLGVRRIELQTKDPKELAEAFSVADSTVNSAEKALAEAINVVDSWVVGLKLSEAFSIADSLVKSATEQLAEAWSVVDSKVGSAAKALAETVSVADSIANSASKALAEASSTVDSRVTSGKKALAEAFSIADSLATTAKKTLAEAISIAMLAWRKLRYAALVWVREDDPVTAWTKEDDPTTIWVRID